MIRHIFEDVEPLTKKGSANVRTSHIEVINETNFN